MKLFENIADDLSILLVEKKIIKPENREFYFYGLHLAISKLFFFLVILVISLFTQTFLVSMAFVFMYSAIRPFSGGYHCKSEVSCFIVSILLYLFMILFYDANIHGERVFLCVAAVVSVLVIMIFSPVEHKNKPLTVAERKKYKIISRFVAAALVLIMCISLLFSNSVLFHSSSYALTADAVLIVMALKGVKHREHDS